MTRTAVENGDVRHPARQGGTRTRLPAAQVPVGTISQRRGRGRPGVHPRERGDFPKDKVRSPEPGWPYCEARSQGHMTKELARERSRIRGPCAGRSRSMRRGGGFKASRPPCEPASRRSGYRVKTQENLSNFPDSKMGVRLATLERARAFARRRRHRRYEQVKPCRKAKNATPSPPA